MFEQLRIMYQQGRLSEEGLRKAVTKKMITEAQAEAILAQEVNHDLLQPE